MGWRCEQGATLLIPSGPKTGQMHLFALALAPSVIDGRGPAPHVLLVCVTSVREGVPHDDACILGPGDHPFIEHASYVDYRRTRMERVDHVELCVHAGTFRAKEACSPALLRKILGGALQSKRIDREYRALILQALQN